MSIQTVGIIGAGTMGSGIAQACAVAGVRVVMVDIAEAAVAKGLASVDASLERLLKKDKISQADKDAALARIRTSTQYEDLKSADLVIEAATENHALKIKIIQQLDALLAPEVILASNTSSISITQLAAVTQRADRFIEIEDARRPGRPGTYTFNGPLAAAYLGCSDAPRSPAACHTSRRLLAGMA